MNFEIALFEVDNSEGKQNKLVVQERNRKSSNLKLIDQERIMENINNSLCKTESGALPSHSVGSVYFPESQQEDEIQMFPLPGSLTEQQTSNKSEAIISGFFGNAKSKTESEPQTVPLSITFGLDLKESLGPAFFNSDNEELEFENTPLIGHVEPSLFTPVSEMKYSVEKDDSVNNIEEGNSKMNLKKGPLSSTQTEIQDDATSKQFKRGRKSRFSLEEDNRLIDLVKKYGEKDWYLIAKEMGRFNRKQIRDHYIHFIKQKTLPVPFTPEEDELMLSFIKQYGRKWEHIATLFPKRNAVALKNRFTIMEKKRKMQLKNFRKLAAKRKAIELSEKSSISEKMAES